MSCLQGRGKERKRKRNREAGDLDKVVQWVSRAGYHCFLLSCAHLISSVQGLRDLPPSPPHPWALYQAKGFDTMVRRLWSITFLTGDGAAPELRGELELSPFPGTMDQRVWLWPGSEGWMPAPPGRFCPLWGH